MTKNSDMTVTDGDGTSEPSYMCLIVPKATDPYPADKVFQLCADQFTFYHRSHPDKCKMFPKYRQSEEKYL
jgi:hypothetical protein